MPERWWITPADSVMSCTEHLRAVHATPAPFGITASDCEFAQRHGLDGDYALLDKVFAAGAIMLEVEGERLTVVFQQESYEAYGRVMKFLGERHFDHRMPVVLKEYATQRRWSQTVEGILKGYQYSREPSRFLPCNNCGHQLSFDEVVHKGVCPRCGQKLT